MLDRKVKDLELELGKLKESFRVRQVRLMELLNRVAQCESMAGITSGNGASLNSLPRATTAEDEMDDYSPLSAASIEASITSRQVAD